VSAAEDYEREAAQAVAHNVQDVLTGGPRLAWGRQTAPLAIDRAARRVLKTGLGVMGVGTAWCDYETEDPQWAGLPERAADRCVHCGDPIKPDTRSTATTGWAHTGSWQGIRCRNQLTSATPGRR
jgi:hypothetical protein